MSLLPQFVGKWWLIRVTERVFNNDEDCAHFVVSKKNGNTYDVLVQFHKTKTDSVRKMDFDITDRTDQPAIYDLLVKGKPIVTAQILGTDYDNWAVIYIAEGTYMIYTVASRTPKLDPQFSSKIEAIMSENGATTTFEEVNGACADTI
ncbi:hypothetical protein BIW11_10088 [Tropilaelaps mercedesae]|uniref:Lipocalin/cytosolic fatty-acid binding domain-containing protein n=1 Tax=Tropilaelaps mercedesae TaxID=418985 RepID=A0A1V9XHI7_9ACAR|nr:hypothetical protein BIW11_10088 [Tropilaelaps mercedesae]